MLYSDSYFWRRDISYIDGELVYIDDVCEFDCQIYDDRPDEDEE